jgi:hypothetical protein
MTKRPDRGYFYALVVTATIAAFNVIGVIFGAAEFGYMYLWAALFGRIYWRWHVSWGGPTMEGGWPRVVASGKMSRTGHECDRATVPPAQSLAKRVWGELIGLERRDIDLDAATMTVERQVVEADGQQIVGPPETDAGVRTVALPMVLVPALRAHLEQFTDPDDDDRVFTSVKGRTGRRGTLTSEMSGGGRGQRSAVRISRSMTYATSPTRTLTVWTP